MKILLASLLFCSQVKAVELSQENTFFLKGPISEITGLMFLATYSQIRKEYSGDLYLVINSGGGTLDSSEEIMKTTIKDKKLHAIIIFAASAAAAISQNVGGKTYIVPKGQLMFHEVKVYSNQLISEAEAENIRKELAESNDRFARACNRRMMLPSYRAKVKQDWWLTASEAISTKAAISESFTCNAALWLQDVQMPIYNEISGEPSGINFCNLLK